MLVGAPLEEAVVAIGEVVAVASGESLLPHAPIIDAEISDKSTHRNFARNKLVVGSRIVSE